MSRTKIAWSLPIWVAIACVLFWVAPDPPPKPPPTQEELAATERATEFVVRDVKRWQAEHGDLSRPWDEANGHLAIVIDDVGRELAVLDKLTALRFRLTFAILPGSVYAAGAQLRLTQDRRRYRELLLHLPMEPFDVSQMSAGPEAHEHFLLSSDERSVLVGKLAAALDSVPMALGVNNHMGSRLTADRAAMDAVMEELARRKLLFLDSRTNPHTVAESSAREHGVLTGARQVFLDNELDVEAIVAQLDRAAAQSLDAPVVAIGHPSVELHEALEQRLPQLHADGVVVYPLSELLARTAQPTSH